MAEYGRLLDWGISWGPADWESSTFGQSESKNGAVVTYPSSSHQRAWWSKRLVKRCRHFYFIFLTAGYRLKTLLAPLVVMFITVIIIIVGKITKESQQSLFSEYFHARMPYSSLPLRNLTQAGVSYVIHNSPLVSRIEDLLHNFAQVTSQRQGKAPSNSHSILNASLSVQFVLF